MTDDRAKTKWDLELIFYEPAIVALKVGSIFNLVGKRFVVTKRTTGQEGLPAIVAEEVEQ